MPTQMRERERERERGREGERGRNKNVVHLVAFIERIGKTVAGVFGVPVASFGRL